MTELPGSVHLVGIGGMHMSAIAQLLRERGVEVSGSDLRRSSLTDRLERLGAVVFEGHDAANIGPAELVVATAAVAEDNPELVEARRRSIPVILRAEMVARLIAGKRVIAVAGTHGKTTTSSLIAFILREAGASPTYLLGGESIDLGGNAAWGGGAACVVEADEYRSAFLEYSPSTAVITNVEPDHLDYFGTEDAYREDFVRFAARLQPGGLLLSCEDDPGAAFVRQRALTVRANSLTYGLSPAAHWHAGNPHYEGARATFDVVRLGDTLGSLSVGVPGEHMVLNALAATAVCLAEGVAFRDVRDAVRRFRGARRRFEFVGEEGGVIVMDDYAHHPSEVRTILATCRNRFAGRRIIGIHQPHTYSRISYLWEGWLECWSGLDALIIVETFAAREQPQPGRGAADLARAIVRPPAQYATDFAAAARLATELAVGGDVVITIGAGDVAEAGRLVLEALRR